MAKATKKEEGKKMVPVLIKHATDVLDCGYVEAGQDLTFADNEFHYYHDMQGKKQAVLKINDLGVVIFQPSDREFSAYQKRDILKRRVVELNNVAAEKQIASMIEATEPQEAQETEEIQPNIELKKYITPNDQKV